MGMTNPPSHRLTIAVGCGAFLGVIAFGAISSVAWFWLLTWVKT